MTIRDEFLAEVEQFMKREGFKDSVFGLQCMNDKSFIRRLRMSGTGLRTQTVDHVRAWMADYGKPKKRSRPKQAARRESVAA